MIHALYPHIADERITNMFIVNSLRTNQTLSKHIPTLLLQNYPSMKQPKTGLIVLLGYSEDSTPKRGAAAPGPRGYSPARTRRYCAYHQTTDRDSRECPAIQALRIQKQEQYPYYYFGQQIQHRPDRRRARGRIRG